jgi:AraC-like DNA-binding protein
MASVHLLDRDDFAPVIPASGLAHAHHYDIRTAAPTSSLVAADEDHTILTAGGRGEYRIPWHSHDCIMIVMPVRGAINYRDESCRDGTCLSEERFVVVPKALEHAGDADNTPHVLLYLTDALMERIGAQLGSLHRVQRRIQRTAFFSVTPEIRMLQYLCFAGDSTKAAVRVSRVHVASALLLHVLAQIERSEPLPYATRVSHGEDLVKEICSFIDLRLSEDISLDSIAQEFGLSRRHATRLFRRWTGLSILEYCEQRRIGNAQSMLTNTSLPVAEIALRLGFESGSALARAMRRVTGHTPSAIRHGVVRGADSTKP